MLRDASGGSDAWRASEADEVKPADGKRDDAERAKGRLDAAGGGGNAIPGGCDDVARARDGGGAMSPFLLRSEAMTLSLADWRLAFFAGGGSAAGSVDEREKADAGREAVLRSLLAKRLSVGFGASAGVPLKGDRGGRRTSWKRVSGLGFRAVTRVRRPSRRVKGGGGGADDVDAEGSRFSCSSDRTGSDAKRITSSPTRRDSQSVCSSATAPEEKERTARVELDAVAFAALAAERVLEPLDRLGAASVNVDPHVRRRLNLDALDL